MMNRYINKLLFTALAVVAMVGCLEKEDIQIEVGTAEAPVIVTPSVGEDYTLDKENPLDTVATFEWQQEAYGVPLAYSYELLIDDISGDFSDPTSLALSSTKSVDITHEVLNKAVLALGKAADEKADIKLRVRSLVEGVSIDTLYSEAVDFTVTPYIADLTGLPEELYMIGDAVGGWSWDEVDLPMIPVHSHPELFWRVVYMNGSGGFKFAPMKAWVNDFGADGAGDGELGERAIGTDNITPPTEAGYYMVVVDMSANKISIEEVAVYLIGDTVGDWNVEVPAGKFTAARGSDVVTLTQDLAAAELRIYAWHPYFTDWWQSEFIVLDGMIEYRGTGDDQERVSSVAGSNTIELNFTTGVGAIN